MLGIKAVIAGLREAETLVVDAGSELVLLPDQPAQPEDSSLDWPDDAA